MMVAAVSKDCMFLGLMRKKLGHYKKTKGCCRNVTQQIQHLSLHIHFERGRTFAYIQELLSARFQAYEGCLLNQEPSLICL